jgi:putative chitinase
MPATIRITASDLAAFSPAMKPFYRDVLLSELGQHWLREAGILASGRRFAHFMAQVGAETAGGTLIRESLTYTTVAAVRGAWSARAAKVSDEWIVLNLLRNPVALGDWAYGGRMGNAKGPEGQPHHDGYDFRGGGWIQTTGRDAVERYCARLGVPIRPDILNDPIATLRFACLEWGEQGCNGYADAGNGPADPDGVMAVSRAINVGNAHSSVEPNGMAHRRRWFAKAKGIWWEAGAPTVPEAAGEQDAAAIAAVRARVWASSPSGSGYDVPVSQPVTVRPPVSFVAEASAAPVAATEPAGTLQGAAQVAAGGRSGVAKPVARAVHSSRTVFGALAALGATIGGFFQDAVAIVVEAAGQIEMLAPAVKVATALGFTVQRVAFGVAIAALALVIFARLDDARKGANVK